MDLYADGQQYRVDPPAGPVPVPVTGPIVIPQAPSSQVAPTPGRVPSPQLHFASGANVPQPAAPPVADMDPAPMGSIQLDDDASRTDLSNSFTEAPSPPARSRQLPPPW